MQNFCKFGKMIAIRQNILVQLVIANLIERMQCDTSIYKYIIGQIPSHVNHQNFVSYGIQKVQKACLQKY